MIITSLYNVPTLDVRLIAFSFTCCSCYGCSLALAEDLRGIDGMFTAVGLARRYTKLVKEKLGTDILDTQLAYSIRFYCMGSVGMTLLNSTQ